MAIVIQLDAKRNGTTKSTRPLTGSAEILIYTGVRFERLETEEQPNGETPQRGSRRNLAV
jgi:hypothetical protein